MRGWAARRELDQEVLALATGYQQCLLALVGSSRLRKGYSACPGCYVSDENGYHHPNCWWLLVAVCCGIV